MSVTLNPNARVDPPSFLPVAYLSVSSMNLFLRCPEAWRRRYIDHERTPPSGKMVLGGAAGAALAQHYGHVMMGEGGLSTDQLLDEFSAQLASRSGREEVVWGEDAPGTLKDTGAAALRIYHQQIAPHVVPVSVEREFEMTWPGVCFHLTGYLDVETADNLIVDFKMSGQRFSTEKATADLQPTVYLAARRAEHDPAPAFQYHCMIRSPRKPTAEIVQTARTEQQLDLLTHRVFSIARAIEWRWLNDCWQGAPPDLAWLCRGCAYSDTCAWSLA